MDVETIMDWNRWKTSGAIYGISDTHMLFWGNTETSIAPSQFPAVYSTDFFLEKTAPWTTYQHVHTSLSIPLETKIPGRVVWEAPDAATFEKQFLWAQEKFQSGELTKVVLTTETRAPKTISPDVFLENALGKIPAHTHMYGQWTPAGGFIGYTPEVLLSLSGKSELHTMALAGTSSLEDIEKNLYSEIIKHEHLWVVEDIAQTLEPFGKVRAGAMKTLELETLAHLQTNISLEISQQQSRSDWIRTLHPTPALGTAPRKEWKQLQPFRKGYGSFGAPFAVATSENETTAVVGTRQLAWDEKYYYIRCGCGVVQDSRLDDEWNELLLKIKSVKKRFGWLRE